MRSEDALHLLNEGALMQSCFKSSLVSLRMGSSAEVGPFYVAFFNFSIGLERLLKVILSLDHWLNDGRFPKTSTLKAYGGKRGHNIEMLYKAAQNLFPRYGVEWKNDLKLDGIDLNLVRCLSDFADADRYFNLEAITEGQLATDPLARWEKVLFEVYEKDVARRERVSSENQVDAFVEGIEGLVVHVPSTSLSGVWQSYRSLCRDHGKMQLVLPEVRWRFVKILIPIRNLLIALRERIQNDDLRKGEEVSVPFLDEFLDFVCEDKNVVLEGTDWP